MTEKKETKGKYGSLIQKAREQENQISGQPDNQIAVEPAQQGEAENRMPDNQITSKPDNQKEREVNLCVKVPESLRRHWAAEAKRQGITMTEVIVEALTQKFGKPDNQQTR